MALIYGIYWKGDNMIMEISKEELEMLVEWWFWFRSNNKLTEQHKRLGEEILYAYSKAVEEEKKGRIRVPWLRR